MDSIIDELMKQVASGDNLSAISQAVGGDPNAVKSALGMGMPLILGAMAKSTSNSGGADMLTNMLSQAGGSNPMDNLSGFLGSPAAAGGSGLVSSLLGSQMGGIQNAIAQKTGLPPEIVGKILAIAAPIVISQVSKMFMGGNMDQKGLTSLLGDQSKMAMQASPEIAAIAQQVLGGKVDSGGIMGMIKKFLK